MFRGHFEHSVDEKGRVAIPARFREALSGLQEERLVLTKFAVRQHRCLDIYPLAAWRELEKRLLGKSRFDLTREGTQPGSHVDRGHVQGRDGSAATAR